MKQNSSFTSLIYQYTGGLFGKPYGCTLPSDDYFKAPEKQITIDPGVQPVLIYQVGKVGSSAIYEAIKDVLDDTPVYQIHNIAQAEQLLLEERAKGFRDGEHHFVTGMKLKEVISSCPKLRWKIVVGVREPIRRWVSEIFQNVQERYAFLLDEEGNVNIETATAFVKQSLKNEAQESWFDHELKTMFGVDVFNESFVGSVQVIHRKNADILLYKYEALGEEKTLDALSHFFEQKELTLPQKNSTSNKQHASEYRDVLETLKLDETFLEKLYTKKVASHFYMQEELNTFIKEWSY